MMDIVFRQLADWALLCFSRRISPFFGSGFSLSHDY